MWHLVVSWNHDFERDERYERIRSVPHRRRGDISSRPHMRHDLHGRIDGGGKLIHHGILRSLAEMHAAPGNLRHDSNGYYVENAHILI